MALSLMILARRSGRAGGVMDNRGRWQRWQKKDVVESYLFFDIVKIAKLIDLESTGAYLCSWTLVDHPCSPRVVIEMVPDVGLRLYRINVGRIATKYVIPIVSTVPNYGGKRYWFECPGHNCRRRVRMLYIGDRLLCRHCLNLTYLTSQSGGNKLTSIDSRLAFLHSKLGGIGSCLSRPLDKPTRMQYRTYTVIVEEYMQLLKSRNEILSHVVDTLLQEIDT